MLETKATSAVAQGLVGIRLGPLHVAAANNLYLPSRRLPAACTYSFRWSSLVVSTSSPTNPLLLPPK